MKNLKFVLTYSVALATLLITSSALAAAPIAVWEGDFADNSTKNNITLSYNDSAEFVAATENSPAYIRMKDDATKGLWLANRNWSSQNITVIIKYSDFPGNIGAIDDKDRVLVVVGGQDNSTTPNNDRCDYYGVLAAKEGTGVFPMWAQNGGRWNKGAMNTAIVPSFSTEIKQMAVAITYSTPNTGTSNGLSCYIDGVASYNNTGLRGDIFTRDVGIFGLYYNTSTTVCPAVGAKVYGIAVFTQKLSEAEIAAYRWPSEKDKSLYAPFLTNFSDRIMTITSTGNANAAVDLGGAATFALFDPNTNLDTATSFTGSAATAQLPGYVGQNRNKAWWGWASNQTGYSAPGLVMRFPEYVSGCSITVGGTFAPFTVGGLIVEEGASSGATVPSWTQASNNRYTELGDMRAADGVPTFFVLRDSFAINRGDNNAASAGVQLYGDITFDIANEKYFDCNTSKPNGKIELKPGAIFRAVGEGVFKVATLTATTATGDVTLDYSAQTLERLVNGTPFITGTLAVDTSTTIVLPKDAVAGVPYKLATTISGETVGVLKLGEDDLPDGATVIINQITGTIGFVDGMFDQNLEENTLFSGITWPPDHEPSAADLVTFNLAEEVELTFDDSFQYMALDLNCAGYATVIIDSALTTPMTINGVEGAMLFISKTAKATITQPIIINGFSKMEVQGEFGAGEILINDGPIINLANGASIIVNSNAIDATFTGEGQVVFDGVAPSTVAKEIFHDPAQWTGTVWLKNLNLTDNNFKMTNYGNTDSKIKLTGITGYAAQESNPGTIDCPIEVELVDENNKLAVDLNNGYSCINQQQENVCTYTFAKITGSGTFKNSGGSCSPQYRFVDVSDFTGKLWVAQNMRFSIGEGVDFGTSGAIVIDGDATINCTLEARVGVSVANGVVLTIPVAEGETKVLPFSVNDSNTIKVTGTTGVFVISSAKLPTFDSSEAAEIELKLMESVGWDGSIDVRFASAEAIPTVRLIRADGATEITEVKTTTSGSIVTYQFAPQVDSSSAWYAWEFEGALTSVGKEKATMGKDYGPFYNLESNAVYAISQPYATVNYPDEFTASIYGTLPETNKAVLVAFGTIGDGGVALTTGDPKKQEVEMVYWPGNPANPEACVGLAKMTVPNAFTSDHLYLFSKTADGIKVYLDGKLAVDNKGSYAFGNGIQVGTIFGGIGNTGLGRLQVVYGVPTATNVLCNALINSLRVYDAALGPKAIELIAKELNYVSANGTYERTLNGNADFLTGAADWTKVGEGAVDAPAENATIELTADTVSELTINLEGTFNAEALTVKGEGAVTFKRGTGILNNAGVTTILTPVTIEYGALDISGNAVTILDGGSLTFDYSTFTLDELPYVTTYYHATGLINGVVTPTAVNLPTLNEGWTCSFELDESTSQWGLKVIPPHEAGVIFTWTSGTYPEIELTLGADEEKYVLADLFPGDKIQLAGDRDYETTTMPEYTLICASDWSGKLKKVGEGVAIFNLGSGFTNDLIIAQGTAKLGADYGFGNYTLTGVQTRKIVVEAGATADLNGIVDQCLAFELNGGTLVNTGADISDNNRQTVAITLTADSYVGGTGNFGLHGSNNAETTLNLGAFTLTKTGSNAFDLANATVNGTGTLKVETGSVRTRVVNSAGGTDWMLDLAKDTALDLAKPLMVGTLTGFGSVTGTETLSVTTMSDYCLIPANAAFAPDATIRLTGENALKDSTNWLFYSGVTLDAVEGASLAGEGMLILSATKTDTTLTSEFKRAVSRGGYTAVFTDNGLELVRQAGFLIMLK